MPTPTRPQLAFLLSFFFMQATAQTASAQTPVPAGSFPRIGNVFNGETLYTVNPSWAYQTQLFLGGNFIPTAAQAVRTNAPNSPLMWKINATETVLGAPVVPDDSYYLKDTNGNNIQTWPGSPGDYLLNLTLPKVQQFLAQYSYQQMTANGFVYDGVFFDNVSTIISNVTHDVYGNPVQISSMNNGIADMPGPLDAAWSAGVYAMLADFKQLAGNAYVTGHINQTPDDPRSLADLNGDSFVFDAVYVREGTFAFGTLWDAYQNWFVQGQSPVVTAMQSSPPSQIAYGYGFTPLTYALPSTVTWGQNFYPNMRFGLSMALMNNGFSIYDFGDSNSAVAWWYDEYNFNLGNPVTPATLIGAAGSASQVVNSGFEGSLLPWTLLVNNDGVARATAVLDTSTFENGASSAHVNVASAATANWHVNFEQGGLSVKAGTEYTVQFWAKADSPQSFNITLQGGTAPYSLYGLNAQITIGTAWRQYSVSFLSNATASDGILGFLLGNSVGNYWLDDVQLTQAPVRIYRRDFTNGVVLLNGTQSTQTITMESGLKRFTGSQSPKHQYIVDDADPGFTTTGSWIVDTFDTGFRTASPPYYHAWKSTLHELDAASGSAVWNLALPADGQYTLQVWLPAAPASSSWTKSATYQVVSGATVLATATLDQSQASAGDQWYTLFTNLNLTAAGAPVLQVTNSGSGPLIADAVYLYSSSRINDGSAVSLVTLQPMDGVLLQRLTPTQSISFATLPNVTLTAAPVSLSATASSSLPITFTSNAPLVCAVSGSTVTLLNTGTCSITATQRGNASFTAAVPVTQTFTVAPTTPAAQTITFAAISSQTLNGKLTLSATASSGLAVIYASATTSTCSVSGNTASLIAAGTCTISAFQPGNPFYAPAPTVMQSFSIVAGPPAIVSVTPSSGSALTQTFAAQFSDPNQGSDLSAILMLFNTSTSGVNACYLQYYASSNLLYLKNDANTAFVGSITPGANLQLSNSKCTLSGSGSSYTTSGTTATLKLALTFTSSASTNIYLDATEKNGATTGFVQKGTWGISVAGVASAVSITPNSGSGTTQIFAAKASDTAGGAYLNAIYLLFNKTLSGTNGCYVEYFVSNNTINLKNDANTGFVGAITPGSTSQLSNSSCTVSGTGSSYVVSGTNATLNLALTFVNGTAPVIGYLDASDLGGSNTGWVQESKWGTFVAGVPSAVSITPTSGSGVTQTFAGNVSDTAGGSSVNAIYMLFNKTLNGANGCYVEYFLSSNTINLKNDANTAFVGAITPGASAQLSNSSCTVSGTGSSYTVAGNNATLNLALTFANGTAPVLGYLYASDVDGNNTGWVQESKWGIFVTGVPSAVSITPNAGTGATQTFAGKVADTAGGSSVNAVYMLLNTTLSGVNGCYLEYFVSSNTINLKNDANTAFVGAITPGSSSQLSNSACTVSGTGSSYAVSGNNATLNLALTFSGTSPLTSFLYVSDTNGANTGWVSEGTWTP